ncbi:uncharacterized protein LOC143295016 [Babylonia areolata]|uniref:uncharacterized protein LOC143295016 n=1 Tax=Babylonia areolata TaxID=304850 RepID=UPI003FD29DE0
MNVLWVTCLLAFYGTCARTQEVLNGAVECHNGSVRCNHGYLYTLDDPSFSFGQQLGQCRRYIWTGHEANGVTSDRRGFPLPRPPIPGWTVCVLGWPTYFTRMTIDLLSEDDRWIVSHLDIRMSGNHGSRFDESVVINEAGMNWNGDYDWVNEEVFYPRPYPFAADRPFNLRIVATENHSLTYYVNGVEVATRRIQRSIRDISKVVVLYDVSLSQVNVWCASPH